MPSQLTSKGHCWSTRNIGILSTDFFSMVRDRPPVTQCLAIRRDYEPSPLGVLSNASTRRALMRSFADRQTRCLILWSSICRMCIWDTWIDSIFMCHHELAKCEISKLFIAVQDELCRARSFSFIHSSAFQWTHTRLPCFFLVCFSLNINGFYNACNTERVRYI